MKFFHLIPFMSLALVGCAPKEMVDTTSQAASVTNAVIVADQDLPLPSYSAAASNILHLVNTGLAMPVLRHQIIRSEKAYDLTSQDLVWLKGEGVPDELISVIHRHDNEVRQLARRAAERQAQTEAQAREVARLKQELELAQKALAQEKEQEKPKRVRNDLPVQVRPFYEVLEPHGAWIKHQSYGLVWQPKTVREKRNWRPYSDNGRWLATDQGWYWHSEYPWGWAAFHYGRWSFDRNLSWIWVPDTIWGPSWVTFRMDRDYVGWAPLPPGAIPMRQQGVYYNGRSVDRGFNYGLSAICYTFVPSAHVFHPSLSMFVVSQPRVSVFFGGTTPINHIVIGTDWFVWNYGIPLSRVASYTPQPVRLATIRSARRGFGSSVRAGGLTTVYRPSIDLIAPVKPATLRTGTTNVPVLVPKHAPENVVIAGEPVVDTSTGRPVVTGYRNPVRYYYPLPVAVPPTTPNGNAVTPAQQAVAVNPVTGQRRHVGFTPAMPQSGSQILGPPRPVSSHLPSPGFSTTNNPATGQRQYRYVPGSSQHHWYNRR
ncbi:MAG: DUF6600 domain-containing protein [Limisphaerales bacterium]